MAAGGAPGLAPQFSGKATALCVGQSAEDASNVACNVARASKASEEDCVVAAGCGATAYAIRTNSETPVEDEEIAALPLMPDSEISPAAFIFKQMEEERGEVDLYEEK